MSIKKKKNWPKLEIWPLTLLHNVCFIEERKKPAHLKHTQCTKAINWLRNHTGKRKHTTLKIPSQLYVFFSPLYFKHYATVPMVIFWAWATRDYTRLKTPSLRCVFVAKWILGLGWHGSDVELRMGRTNQLNKAEKQF